MFFDKEESCLFRQVLFILNLSNFQIVMVAVFVKVEFPMFISVGAFDDHIRTPIDDAEYWKFGGGSESMSCSMRRRGFPRGRSL